LTPDKKTCVFYGQIAAEPALVETAIPQNDVWIAALREADYR
jgi:predicted nucleic acid-binding protein